jgi:glycosyltransferase involved in cell wall biosynthesis
LAIKNETIGDIMNHSPLVSIIIPTYNDGHVICDAIDCSLNQTYNNLEIIVVDDGSIDGTDQLLKEKYGSRIKYIRQENKGPSAARNNGIRHASGEYLQFLDADDLIDLDKINIQIRELQNIPGSSLSYCDYVCCDENDITIVHEKRISPVLQREKPFDDIMMKWETELSIPMHCFIFDATFFKEHGLAFDESLPSNEDWECWMNIFAFHPTVVFIDRVLAYYRRRRDSRCGDRVKMRQGYLMAINKQMQKYKKNKEVFRKLNIRKKQIKYFYRDMSPVARMMDGCHPIIRNVCARLVPQRIKRIFD